MRRVEEDSRNKPTGKGTLCRIMRQGLHRIKDTKSKESNAPRSEDNIKEGRTASLMLPPAPSVRLVYECKRSRRVPLLCTMGWKVPVEVGGMVVVVVGCWK